ncbi:MAG: hypothetical protein QOG27_408 [Verrucomicrobiota bacterium]
MSSELREKPATTDQPLQGVTDASTTTADNSLYNQEQTSPRSGVRLFVPLLTLLLCTCELSAQEQESKLIDRLLKPNTSLKNPAETKQFRTPNAALTDKQVSAPNFSFREKSPIKAFPDQRAVASKEIPARPSPAGASVADLSSRSRLTATDKTIRPPAVQVQVAHESGTTSPTRQFAGNRPFLVEGKSQKALKNKPLTIEQVRELLNKSK